MNVIINPEFNPIPSLESPALVELKPKADKDATVAVFVTAEGELPADVAVTREQLAAAGFKGKAEQSLVLPGEVTRVLVGVGEGVKTVAEARNAAAVFARAAAKSDSLALNLAELTGELTAQAAAQAAVEGVVLARYRYDALKTEADTVALSKLTVVSDDEAAQQGIDRAAVLTRAALLARDLGNTPPRHLNATQLAEIAEKLGPEFGFAVEVFDRKQIQELGLGGLLGVNAGSVEEPRLIKVSYKPADATGHLGLVGKGIMYDSGGISLKPSNASHCSMKMDMMGAGAVLSAMTALRDLGVKTAVTGWLMCTDNMPSGSSTKLGDVLTMRGGKTVEVRNTDAEGRLVLGDGIALAVEEKVDAVVDIATLTGAAMMALGAETAAVFANNDELAKQLKTAAVATDEVVWQLPLDSRLRKSMKSKVADIANIGGSYGGAITAALFLQEFAGDTPWGHLDIAGPMEVDSDDLWRSAGSTGFGARLLAEFAQNFTNPGDQVNAGGVPGVGGESK